MGKFGIRAGYSQRLFPEYFNDTMPDGKIWQPDVYGIAAHLAHETKRATLIDIGCGRGHKLLPLKDEFRILGVDTGSNIDYCQDNYNWGEWIACDLEKSLPTINGKAAEDAVVICADVIEHLIDPSMLMATLEKLAERAPVVLLSTPDRARVYGYDQDGPPGNPHHVREWMLPEMVEWLSTYELRIAWAGWTRSNNVDVSKNTLLIAATNPRSSYTVEHLENAFDVEAWKYA